MACNSATNQKQKASNFNYNSKSEIQKLIDSAGKGYPYEIIQTYLNNDTVPDYFVIDHSGISTGLFFDGKRGNEIPTDGINVPWSRPGVELNYQIIHLVCKNLQNEILVRGGSGGTAGLNLTTEIYRFDSTQGIMKLIFQKDALRSHRGENGSDVNDEINYIKLIYSQDSCDNKILVCKGTYKNDTIIPVKNSKKNLYHFNEYENQFESYR